MPMAGFRAYFARRGHPRNRQPLLPLANTLLRTRHPSIGVVWPQVFVVEQTVNLAPLNKTYIEQLRDEWKLVDITDDVELEKECESSLLQEAEDGEMATEGEDELETDAEPDDAPREDKSVASMFMRNRLYAMRSETSESWHPESEIVDKFCGHITFEDLDVQDDAEQGAFCFLEDSSRAGKFRKSRGSLESKQLVLALREPRYQLKPPRNAPRTGTEPDVDQRRLCITNVTPKIAAIIMATATSNEHKAVQDLLPMHIYGTPHIGVKIPSRGFMTFALHLSIPFYTLKKEPQIFDERRIDQGPLRKTIDVPKLGVFREAQVSIVLTGTNDSRWTAIALIDNSNPMTAAAGPGEEPLPFNLRRDYIAGVNFFPDRTETDARLYFMWLWKERTGQILSDLTEVVTTVTRAVDQKNYDDAVVMGSKSQDEKIAQLKCSMDVAGQWALLLAPMQTKLRGMLDAWRRFQQEDAKYFQDISIPRQNDYASRDSFGALVTAFNQWEILLKRLENAMSTLSEKSTQLNNALGAEIKDRADSRAAETARSTRRANITTMCFLPAMVAFTLFSMEKTAIPVAANLESLLFILSVLVVMTIVLFNYVDIILTKGGDLLRPVRQLLMYVLRSLQPPGDVEAEAL